VRLAIVVAIAACGPEAIPPQTPHAVMVPEDAALVSVMPPDAEPDAAIGAAVEAPADAAVAEPEVWLKGSTHVHARPSGDSSEPIDKVIAWYEAHGYDFIALTDHNRVTAVEPAGHKLVVLPGIELTHNPSGCLPQGDKSKKCRIHVNVLGVTARPEGKIEWAERHSHERTDMYRAAFVEAKALGGAVVQINHPQWYWGMNGELLAELAHEGAKLVEIANVQFGKWNAGDSGHASTEALWDAALGKGETIWGVASDDAHDYEGTHQKYPAGGGWVVVKARRDPKSILDALAAGHFYASTGVVLARAEVDAGELVVEVAAGEPGKYEISWIENGKLVDTTRARSGRRAVPKSGYVRAVVTRDDGKHAWVEPARP
jgi:hypothetical protein